ncbi:class I SAM-dependent methyltransferase [Clostridium tagluense]|uniref:class I SAM-dependent methyltransferase n=1 Tax=Clostridium tagluense TaxID=360422 RepID=UPI001C6EF5B7|nr:class I SAM-dependent methyltransferase [Clostridium tagluense]MBW9158596.1 class I SAM-dependent methyltransferase [Clostridium tagluense]WLC63672.1 class I SAM-dependent methyltransferase [Clostridium tagluense]
MTSEAKEILKQSYNNYAHEREKNEFQVWKAKPRDAFLKLLLSEGKSTLLDIGAGIGRDSKFFMNNDINVLAVDLSDEMIRLCHEKEIESYQLDFYNLHKIGKKFDAVWSMNSLLHVEKVNLNLVLEEIRDVLSPLGLFFMGVYGGEDSEGIWQDDIYTPHRFFSSYTDVNIKEVVSNYFEIISFERIETGGKYHFQSIIMRKK